MGAASTQFTRMSTALEDTRARASAEGPDILTGMVHRTRTTIEPHGKEAQKVLGRVGTGVRELWNDTIAALTEDSADDSVDEGNPPADRESRNRIL